MNRKTHSAKQERAKANAVTIGPLGQGKLIPLSIKLIDTDEVFQLKGIRVNTTIRELKGYLEYATGIPVSLQQIHYLDEGDLQDRTDIRSNDIVPGGQLHMRIWHTWVKLVRAVKQNNINQVLQLGTTKDSTYQTPNSEYMNVKARPSWLAERAFVALFIACHRGHVQLVKTLIETGANVNMKTTLGRTPLHVSAAQDRGAVVDLLLKSGADVNEVDSVGDSALDVAETFGHKDGARHLFLFRWQVRAKQSKKVPAVPLYDHQQCDTANPVWLSGGQGQIYFANNNPAAIGRKELPPVDLRVKQKIGYDSWLAEKVKEDMVKMERRKAEKEAEKLEEEKRKEQYLIDKESYETWIKKQQEAKEKAEQVKKKKSQNKGGSQVPDRSKGAAVAGNSLRASEDLGFGSSADADSESLQNYLRNHKKIASTYDQHIFQNELETFDKVKSVTLKQQNKV